MSVRVLGLNLSHDSSVCLIEDGRIVSALALERTSRVKRGVVATHAYAAHMARLIKTVVGSHGVSLDDIDWWVATSTEARCQAEEDALADALGLLVPDGRRISLPHPSHHLAHASAAFYTSGFNEAAALVVDAYGSQLERGRERETAFAFSTDRKPVRTLSNVRPEARIAGRRSKSGGLSIPTILSGLGEIYRVVSLALGFYEVGTTYDDAGKTMGLAPYGAPLSQDPMFIRVEGFDLDFSRAFESLLDLKLARLTQDGAELVPAGRPLTKFHFDVAAQLQAEFEVGAMHLVQRALMAADSSDIVLSGGCFLNATLNAKILRETAAERVFVFPAATDDGNAAGAALYVYNNVATEHRTPPSRIQSVHLGPRPAAASVVSSTLARYPCLAIDHKAPLAAARAAAACLAKGEVIGWFQGRSEFGPRALGGRSILAHPGISGMKDLVNARIKFREPFRPFAASVLAEEVHNWFDVAPGTTDFMLAAVRVLPDHAAKIREVIHVDETCRIQTVHSDSGPRPFRRLIEHFYEATGLPLVLNTSMNLRGQPMVETLEEGIDCLFGSTLDRLFVGQFEVSIPDRHALVPQLTRTGSWTRQQWWSRVDGVANVREIAENCEMDPHTLIAELLTGRLRGEIAWKGVPVPTYPTMPRPQYEAAE